MVYTTLVARSSAGASKAAAALPLSRDRLVDEALAIVDAEGFAGLSLRAVARRLSVTPMALYRHVQNSQELADLVVSRIVSERTEQTQWPDDPRAALRTLATTVVDLIRTHPALFEAYQRGGVFTPPAMHAVDQILAALRSGGLDSDDAMNAYLAVHCYALGFAALTMDTSQRVAHEVPDPQEYPTLAAEFDSWLTLRDGARFRDGLELVLAGVLADRAR